MIEIVFNESAAGSLKIAQGYGKGKYPGGATSMFICHKDGSQPTEAELEAAKREYIEKEKRAWETAVPLGGSSADVFCFDLGLSIGDISGDELGYKRQQILKSIISFPDGYVEQKIKMAQHGIESIFQRMEMGEAVRIWYSNNPDEYCGLYWFMHHIFDRKISHSEIYIIKIPDWEYGEGTSILRKKGCGELSAEEWHKYLPLQQAVTDLFVKMCAWEWKELKEENAQLRAVINGRLMSVSEALYDRYIYQEIAKEAEEFSEARIIGNVLGKHQVAISDSWIHGRIENMISNGELEVVSEADLEMPVYRRKLRKKIRK